MPDQLLQAARTSGSPCLEGYESCHLSIRFNNQSRPLTICLQPSVIQPLLTLIVLVLLSSENIRWGLRIYFYPPSDILTELTEKGRSRRNQLLPLTSQPTGVVLKSCVTFFITYP